ncbi:otogelin-like protein [Polyodon spathula]|uniref:otogelin-like protein n=1 Tax=Polyodon spathula TaxID=7913 RepID=UPI001B7E7161|nr:otogelin-like protein [Polyodon spathula]
MEACSFPCLNGGECVHPDSCNCSQYQATGDRCQTVPNVGYERDMICRTWGQYNYETFDGLYYYFPGKCTYTLVRECGEETEPSFVIQVHNDPECHSSAYSCSRSVSLFFPVEAELRLNRYNVTYNGQSIELPHIVHDVEVERVSQYTLVTLQHGFTLAWDGSTSSVYIKMSPEYVGRTCGLCGSFNADIHDDLQTSYDLFTHDTAIFGNSWMEMVPHEHSCPSVPANYPSPCLTQNYETRQKVQEMCILLLETPFKECHDLVSPFPFMASCSNDLCIAGTDNQVLCQALAEYARACAHAEHPLYDWREVIPMCAVDCDDEFTYRECITCCPVSCNIDKMCIDSKLQCLDGCYCLEDLIYDNGSCVKATDCPCEYHGMLYSTGQEVQDECNSCSCMGGSWNCTEYSCPGECSVTGDIHFETFDGRVYTFQATCQYILAKSRSTGKFTISLQNAPCGANLDGACIQSVNIIVDEDPMKQITVTNMGEVYVSNMYRISPPYSDAVFQIHELSSMFLQVKTEDGLRLQYNWKELRLYLQVDESWKEDTVGLCGTFNGNIQDDFLSPAGMIESTPQLFGNSWKLSSSCVPVHNIPQLDPCDIHQQAASYASEMCEILNKELFAPCHEYLSPTAFYQQCKSDTCKCGETCLCGALGHYTRQCRKHGVIIDFRAHVSECAAQCQETMEYGTCISSCNRNCRSLSLSEACGEECVEGCVCPGGTYYNSKSQKCVQKNECSCNFLGAEYAPGDIIIMSSGTQICKDGQMMYQGPSIDTKCPPGQFYFKCSDSLDSSTVSKGVTCERTCESHLLNLTCSGHGHCVSGCICPPGFLKHGDECFEPVACPCLWKGKEYYPGDKVTSPCHSCVCQHGSFQCIFHPCPSMCTVYGDRHYRTFDGLLFDYIGACKVYLVKSNIDLTMSVSAENVDCYESGVICRKSLLINIGRSFIVFDNDSGKPNPSSLIDKRQPVFIWQAGYYTIIHIPTEDVTVLWDRKTTIHIQVGPRWQGKLTGLCGNFDLKTVNEMRTPENIESATPQEFGKSWTAAECVNSPDIRNPCSMNPLREPFAKRECRILLSEVFQACHPVVDVTWFYMNCLTDTCGCNHGGDCECFCTSVSAYAHRCCQQGIAVDWRSPTVCPYDCEFYNKVLGKGPFKLVTYLESETVLAANFSGGAAFPVQGAVSFPGVAMLFMLTPGLSRSRPHDTTLVSLESAERPNYFLHLGPSGYLRVSKWEESERFQEASTFIIHKDTWLAGYDSFESYMKPGFFVHYMLSSIHLMKYNHSGGFRQATLFKLEGIKPAVAVDPITPQSTVSTPGAVTSPSVKATVSLGSTLPTTAPTAAARTTTETQRTPPTPPEASSMTTISPKPLGPTIQTMPGNDTTESFFTTITTQAPKFTKPEGTVTFSPTVSNLTSVTESFETTAKTSATSTSTPVSTSELQPTPSSPYTTETTTEITTASSAAGAFLQTTTTKLPETSKVTAISAVPETELLPTVDWTASTIEPQSKATTILTSTSPRPLEETEKTTVSSAEVTGLPVYTTTSTGPTKQPGTSRFTETSSATVAPTTVYVDTGTKVADKTISPLTTKPLTSENGTSLTTGYPTEKSTAEHSAKPATPYPDTAAETVQSSSTTSHTSSTTLIEPSTTSLQTVTSQSMFTSEPTTTATTRSVFSTIKSTAGTTPFSSGTTKAKAPVLLSTTVQLLGSTLSTRKVTTSSETLLVQTPVTSKLSSLTTSQLKTEVTNATAVTGKEGASTVLPKQEVSTTLLSASSESHAPTPAVTLRTMGTSQVAPETASTVTTTSPTPKPTLSTTPHPTTQSTSSTETPKEKWTTIGKTPTEEVTVSTTTVPLSTHTTSLIYSPVTASTVTTAATTTIWTEKQTTQAVTPSKPVTTASVTAVLNTTIPATTGKETTTSITTAAQTSTTSSYKTTLPRTGTGQTTKQPASTLESTAATTQVTPNATTAAESLRTTSSEYWLTTSKEAVSNMTVSVLSTVSPASSIPVTTAQTQSSSVSGPSVSTSTSYTNATEYWSTQTTAPLLSSNETLIPLSPQSTSDHTTTTTLVTSTKMCTPQYSELIDECTKYVCMNGQLMLFNKSQNCPYNATPPNCGLLGFAILVNGDKCCPQWDCPCRCSVFPDLNIITFDGNSVAIYKAASYIVTQLPNETVSIQVQECQSSDTLLWNFTNLCLIALNITHKAHHVLIDRLQRRLYVNSRYARPRFRKNGFEILDTGNMYLIKTPAGLKIQWFHSTGMMVIETDSPSHKLTTMGLCGCCDGDPANDLTLFNGTTVSESEDPTVFIDSWQVPNTTSFMGQNRRREVNCSTSDCSECLSMLSNQTFSSCHAFVPPKMFCEVWVRDAEYVKSPCTALAAYVAACHKFSICIEWRSPDYCSFMCPPELRYQACLPACNAKTCPNHEFDSDPEECSGLTEGCVCPEGTLLHRPYSALCIPSEKCACTDSFGTPHASGEVWKASKDGCCMYKCDNDSIIPVEYNCTEVPEPVCSKAGEVTVSLADDKSCCPQKACVCNQTLCDQYAPECKYGEKLVSYYRDYSCCPDYICECDPDRCESDIPTCRDDQTLIATRTEGSCCMAYICMCGSCSDTIPTCQEGEVFTVDANSTDRCCPPYHCVCETYRCREHTCPLGMSVVTVWSPDLCCPLNTCECACDTIPKPQCKLGEMLQIDSEFLTDPENQCGCSKYKCVKEQVCVDGERGVMRPGQTLVEHTAEGICYTTQCTSHTDPVTSFYKIQASSTNCTAQCEPNQVYKPPDDLTTCCGVCRNTSCIYQMDNGSIALYKPGTTWMSNCKRYECMDTMSGPTLISYSISCPPFNETECMKIGGTVISYMDGCCKTCKEDGKSCQKVTVRMTIRKNDCRSNRPVNIVSCDGKCPSASIYNYNINTYARFCKCCREIGLQRRSVQLYCSGNSTWVYYSIQEPTDCSCQWS